MIVRASVRGLLVQRTLRLPLAFAVEAADVGEYRRGGDDERDDPQHRPAHVSLKSTPGASLKPGSRVRLTARICSTPSWP